MPSDQKRIDPGPVRGLSQSARTLLKVSRHRQQKTASEYLYFFFRSGEPFGKSDDSPVFPAPPGRDALCRYGLR
jgi:hypothetical protein